MTPSEGKSLEAALLTLLSQEKHLSLKELKAHAAHLHQKYSANPEQAGISSQEEALSYAFSRMPATILVLKRCLQEIPLGASITSILDIGSGTGSLLWALQSLPLSKDLKQITLIEKNPHMLWVAKSLASFIDSSPSPSFQQHAIETLKEIPKTDLITLSYACNEISLSILEKQLPLLWESTQKHLLIIDPGTPNNHKKLLKIRQSIINLGGFVTAPCGHMRPCPLSQQDQWCHFGLRLPRSKTQRYIKNGEAPFENEKYIYMLFSKEPPHPTTRILDKPIKDKKGLTLTLCDRGEIKKQTLSKKHLTAHPELKNLSWGDPYND